MSTNSGIIKACVIIGLSCAIFGSAGFFGYKIFVIPKAMVRRAASGPRPTLPPDPSIPEYERCLAIKKSGNISEAQKEFQGFVEHNPDSPKINEAKQGLGELNMALLYSNAPDADKQQYVIQKGDTLGAIERKIKIPGELIMRLNRIDDPTKLRIGEVLNVSKPDFSLKIDRKSKCVVLLNKGRFFKEYAVKTWNAPNPKKPVVIVAKITEKVAWKNNQRVAFASKDYENSGRWISLSVAGFTLYTDDPETGTPKPQGGLGMSVEDMDELSTLLNRNTPARID